MCGLYSLDAGDWRDEVFQMCELSCAQMPRLVDIGERASCPAGGRAAGCALLRGAAVCCPLSRPTRPPTGSPRFEGDRSGLGFPLGLGVVFAGNDQTASALANGCRAGEMVVSLGTTLVAYGHAGSTPGPYNAETCWGSYPGGGFYELAVQDEGGAALEWARRRLAPDDDLDAFIERAEAVAHSQSAHLFFYPQRMGTDGAWRGQGSRDAMAFAVLEGLSFSLRRLVSEQMQAPPLSSVCATGGGSKNVFSRQLLANVLDCPVARGPGDALLGAAMMAIPSAGPIAHSASDVAVPQPEEAARYDRLYHEWRGPKEP